MGGSGSRLEKENISAYGLENFGNTCYCNSVLQALYYCQPFRRRVLEYLQEHEKDAYKASEDDTSLLMCLAELFHTISISKKKQGVIAPRKFVSKVKKENELFRSFMHQDAHEFLNYLLNEIDEQLKKEARERPAVPPEPPSHGKRGRSNSIRLPPLAAPPTVPHDGDARPPTAPLPHPTSAPILHTLADGRGTPPVSAAPPPSSAGDGEQRTWIHEIFQGVLTSETRCLNCEATTCRDERFIDLSLDIEQNTSLTYCLKSFGAVETLGGNDKFFCETCRCLQEAQRRMRVKRLPRVLALHLKRFKYIEQLQARRHNPARRYKKLSYRVVFPLELKVCNASEGAEDPDRPYSLFAVVVHVGSGPNHGHYVTAVRSGQHWVLFDDDTVELLDEGAIQAFFGLTQDSAGSTEAAYILFYASEGP
eukprot:tig00020554_g10858.t1